MKKLFLIVAAMFAVVSFSACSDDKDEASIVGERGRLLIMKGGRRSAMVHEMIGRMHIPLRQKATIIGHTLSMKMELVCKPTIQIIKTMIARPCISHILLMATHSQ